MVTLGAQIISDKPQKMRSSIVWMRSLGIFDEIVAVADVDRGDEILESAKLADKYIPMTFEHQEEAIKASIDLSTTDWMFRIDDDELMGQRFIKGVRNLVENPTADCYWFPRMWLFKDSQHFLSGPPWYPDSQLRLFRRGSIEPASGVHVHPTVLGTSTSVNYNIFHYLLLDTNYEQRVEKCKEYARLMNFTLDMFLNGFGLFYIPEHFGNFAVDEIVEEL